MRLHTLNASIEIALKHQCEQHQTLPTKSFGLNSIYICNQVPALRPVPGGCLYNHISQVLGQIQ